MLGAQAGHALVVPGVRRRLRSIQQIPSAATSLGSQSEWSRSGALATKPSDATGTSIRNVFTAMP